MADELWRPFPFDWRPSPEALSETLLGGQAFRWRTCGTSMWQGIWDKYVVVLRQLPDLSILWRGTPDAEEALKTYFASGTNFDILADSLPWRSDQHVAHALERWRGLRILKQPFAETLLAFLCSPTKRIPQISATLDQLALKFGATLVSDYRALPGWHAIHDAGEVGLRSTGMGYRARGIAGTAAFIVENPGWLEETEHLPYGEAKARLISLPGVGEKIADCVLLFGAGRLEAFPVDTWVIKAMGRLYGLDGWTPAQIAHFGRIHFGTAAGYAQQVLFTEERKQGRD